VPQAGDLAGERHATDQHGREEGKISSFLSLTTLTCLQVPRYLRPSKPSRASPPARKPSAKHIILRNATHNGRRDLNSEIVVNQDVHVCSEDISALLGPHRHSSTGSTPSTAAARQYHLWLRFTFRCCEMLCTFSSSTAMIFNSKWKATSEHHGEYTPESERPAFIEANESSIATCQST